MLKRVNHIAIAVPDLAAAASRYRDLGVTTTEPQELPEHGVRIVFVEFENTKIELLEPLGPNSPIAAFLERQPAGGIHHVCFDVDDISAAIGTATANGIRLLGGGEPKIGAHGNPVVFAHPKDFQGTLVEFEEN
ncbi:MULTISPECIES: methylmalonyl-CoA epimerase [unclassified Shinella]|jgi:methylmalonyl-CoA/ethylmalonyl-CoA epimerase|uniref:methylmalonyl-CoA epimerase n=1 Tax=unclassified Shinella TaxID=2643062 RepID=UPI000437AB87|nr:MULTISPECIES: methylmalonyl-CoA epimerase [unclassified Shinella]MCA0341023.1 methylmalonyl-CoA epimerase [Pseudomonadota bacterium]EYR84013.1 methylmalonyl-CoA epimerase [Shinella sp. DD12]KNY16271.1 methylmalonyl-CoA epimerase [Shinella sp. SUS2]KOC75284.1 methylmalonyl-CoA epimerase [Shinella sp. GWS1]MCO5151358.1 methylmalonyl-CoA epimerase [Shinella sp.]